MPVNAAEVWLCSIRVVQGKRLVKCSLMRVGGEDKEGLLTSCFRVGKCARERSNIDGVDSAISREEEAILLLQLPFGN